MTTDRRAAEKLIGQFVWVSDGVLLVRSIEVMDKGSDDPRTGQLLVCGPRCPIDEETVFWTPDPKDIWESHDYVDFVEICHNPGSGVRKALTEWNS